MIYTLFFGARVRSADDNLGKLERIILNNGIANQLSVDPGLLGYERVVPITIIDQTSEDDIEVTIGENDWKAYPAFTMERSVASPSDDDTSLTGLVPDLASQSHTVDPDHPTLLSESSRTERTVDEMSVVLTDRTTVVFENRGDETHRLRGLIVDTGRVQQLVLDNGVTVSADDVTLMDEARIHVGGQHQQPVLDADRGYEATEVRDPKGDERR